uniref:3'-5' exonuclease n=1 Tax=Murinocardiopsis flavida TaxID=645275 RepID=UPI001FE304D7|nr:3'-5' exonuclease [Murinocardiopsis flavida]
MGHRAGHAARDARRGRAAPGTWGLRTGALTRARTGLRARDLHYAVVDVETTGLDPAQGARVCEIAVVRMAGDGTVLAEFSTLVDPGAPISGQEFHAIEPSDLVGAPTAADIVEPLATMLSGAVVVGHNLDFEERFLAAEFGPLGLRSGLPGLCTLRTLRAQIDLPRYSLPRASHTLSGHWPTGQHTAMGDARACAQLLAELIRSAPGDLWYDGPLPKLLGGAAPRRGLDGLRLKSRTSRDVADVPLPDGPGRRTAPLRVPVRWSARWRDLELDPVQCAGPFSAEQRVRAAADARRRRFRAEAVSAGVALAGALAISGAVGVLRRRLRSP